MISHHCNCSSDLRRTVCVPFFYVIISIVCWLTATDAVGQEKASVFLEYRVLENTAASTDSECPPIGAVKRAVETRIGYAPWDDSADRHIEIVVSPAGGSYVVQILLKDRTGNVIGRREVVSHENCTEAMTAASLTLAIAIAPTAALTAPATDLFNASPPGPAPSGITKRSEDDTATAGNTAADSPRPQDPIEVSSPGIASNSPGTTEGASTPATERRQRFAPHGDKKSVSAIIYAGGLVSWGALPGIAGGAEIGVGLRRGTVRFNLGFRYDFPRHMTLSEGRIRSHQMLGVTSLCLGKTLFFGCTEFSLGQFRAEGHGLQSAESSSGPAAFAAARLGTEIPFNSRFLLQLYATLAAAIFKQKLLERGSEHLFWETPPVGATAGASLIFAFF